LLVVAGAFVKLWPRVGLLLVSPRLLFWLLKIPKYLSLELIQYMVDVVNQILFGIKLVGVVSV